jgi:hypothetical protein
MRLQTITVLASCLLTFTARGSAKATPEQIPSPIQKIFIPNGFDDNDNVEVVLHGEYPNTCYRTGKSGAKIDEETKTITVWATSYRYGSAGTFCAQVITPFIQVVKVGLVNRGNYRVVYNEDANIARNLTVKPRTSESPDDYLYAPIENASVLVDERNNQTIQMQGHFPYMLIGCMRLKEVVVQRDPEDVLVVLPITEIVNDESCEQMTGDHYFEAAVQVTDPLDQKGLLHVRTLNGNAINQLVTLPD